MRCAVLSTLVGSCVLGATIPSLEFIEDIGCETASTPDCIDRCDHSVACQSAVLYDLVWDQCCKDMTSECKWTQFMYLSYPVDDRYRSCIDLQQNAIMLSHAMWGYTPPFGPEAPAGIRWVINSANVKTCQGATFTVEMTPNNQDINQCSMSTAGGPTEYERHQRVPLRVIDYREETKGASARVAVIAKNAGSQIAKNGGLTIRITIEQIELAQQCLFSDNQMPPNPAIVQGKYSTAAGM